LSTDVVVLAAGSSVLPERHAIRARDADHSQMSLYSVQRRVAPPAERRHNYRAI